MNLRGSVTETDNTTQNPGPFGEPCNPTDKSGCGTRKLKSSYGYLQDPAGRNRLAFDATGIVNAFGSGDCGVSSNDFGLIDGRFLPKLHVAVPKPAKLARKRKAFSVSAQRRDSSHRDNGGDQKRRSVTVKFTPQR
jgi:hypothetical protein